MRMNRFYCPLPLENTSQLALPEAAARHASRVLRLREGDDLILFDGHGGEYVARIARIERAQVVVNVLTWKPGHAFGVAPDADAVKAAEAAKVGSTQ